MTKQEDSQVRGRNYAYAGTAGVFFVLLVLGGMWAIALAGTVLCRLFPVFKAYDWVLLVIFGVGMAVYTFFGLLSVQEVVATREEVAVYSLGLRLLALSDPRLICMAGDNHSIFLCLTSYTLEQMAQMEEKHILRHYFLRHELPLILKKPNSREILAKRYVNRIRKKVFGVFRNQNMVFMEMDSVTQQRLCGLYPQLPYYNLTGIRKDTIDPCRDKTEIPCFWMPAERYRVSFTENAILVQKGTEIKRTFSAQSIQTVARVDVFRSNCKYYPSHLPVLFVSVFSPQELADPKTEEMDGLLQAMDCAQKQVVSWTWKKSDFCNLPYTPQTVQTIKRLCPNARWLDISDSWIYNKE